MSILASASDETITDPRQLVEYFESGAKPKSGWLIGCEHEKFPFRLSSLKPVSYKEPQGLRELYEGMRQFGWEPIIEGSNIIGLTRDKAAISFEPGGQVELSGAPLADLHEVKAELDQHLTEINAVAEKLDIGFLGMGFHPTAKRSEIAWVPKQRYAIMRQYMPKKGMLGLDMMLRTCTVQVNLDYSSEADMVKKFRVATALQPIATALFASSPFVEGRVSGFKSYRMQVWNDTDNERSGPPVFAFEDGFGYERYVNYALSVPMYFVYRDGKYIDCSGFSFSDFLLGKLPQFPGQLPTMTDWANHLTTAFPDVRLKKIIEMRGADMGSAAMTMALPAFWVGLLYDQPALDAAWDMVKHWQPAEIATARQNVPGMGLKAEIDGKTLLEIASTLMTLSRQGLRRRRLRDPAGVDETAYLDPLLEIVDRSRSHADELVIRADGQSGEFSMNQLFETERLKAPQT
jgi:glutamate--cysteine ligase